MVNNPRLGRFYLLPKIHKRLFSVPGRPVVSNCNYSTEKIAEFLDFHLKPLCSKVKSYLKDTSDFLRKVKTLPLLPENSILCTMDVVGLYPNIPHEGGLKATENALNERIDKSVTTDSLMELADLALKSNYFEHNSKLYKQVQGTAIGAKFAPSYAILFMGEFEEKAINSSDLKPLIWWRYIDDVFMVWEHGEEALKQFFSHLNRIDPNIQFENPPKYSTECVDFLDVKVTNVGGKLKTDLFTKATDTHQYLQFSSCHSFHTKRSIPYSQALRLRRICSEEQDFVERVGQLKGWLYKRGYEKELVEKQISEATRISREIALHERVGANRQDKDVLVLTYHPALSKKVQQIMNKNHNILSLGAEHRQLFPKTPMVTFRNSKSLKDILVRAMLKSQSSDPNICRGCNGRSDCQVCHILINSDKFSNKEGTRTYNLRKGTFHCNSKGLVYLLNCKTCEKQYIGSTVTTFRERYNNYKSKFRAYYRKRANGTLSEGKPIQQASLYEHFIQHGNITGFSKNEKENWSFWSFQLIDSSFNATKLLERESFWQYKLDTFEPHGLNQRNVPFN